MIRLSRRAIVLRLAFVALVATSGAASVVACSSDEASSPLATGDASTDGSDGSTAPDVPAPPDTGKAGNCSDVRGPCDLVLQDCPDKAGAKQECVVSGADGSFTTVCREVQPSQYLPVGAACCPGTENTCLPGLRCVGEPCADGGVAGAARCTPSCCLGDHAACGKSDPEGIAGSCDLLLASGETRLTYVCTYRERCRPFGIEACRVGQVCLIEDELGTASCVTSNGKGYREPCQYANDCQDGMICIGGGDAGRCRMLCLTPNSNPPFDASAADGAPGQGGCPVSETCTGPRITGLPDTMQLCQLPDGG